MTTRQRNNKIRKLIKKHTRKELAEKFNLTTERIRQILYPQFRNWCSRHSRWIEYECELCQILIEYPRELKKDLKKQIKILSKPDRNKETVWKRALLVKFLRNQHLTYPRIGQLIKKDHSTILYLAKKIL